MRPGGTEPGRPRVFGIGLNKTGTSSFHDAVTILGLESLHWGGPSIRIAVETAAASGRPLLSGLDPTYDAFSDILALSTNFALLDEQYPGSRFVLTVRPVDDWIDSRRRHVEKNIRRRAAGEYAGSFLEVDEAGWRSEWDHHTAAVRRYFAGRRDYLELDLATTAGWGPLCSLLDVPEPAEPYPWANRDPVVHGHAGDSA
jgi:Sulfotransferase domain